MADNLIFPFFALAWIPTRHGVLPMIYGAVLMDSETKLRIGGCNCGDGAKLAYNPSMNCNLSPEALPKVWLVYKVALALFQVLMLIWLRDILAAVAATLRGDDLSQVEASSNQALAQSGGAATQAKKAKKA